LQSIKSLSVELNLSENILCVYEMHLTPETFIFVQDVKPLYMSGVKLFQSKLWFSCNFEA